MAATKLNPAAAPFPCPYERGYLAPPPPPSFDLAPAYPPSPFPFTTYCCVAAHHGHVSFCFPAQPASLPAPVPGKGGVLAVAAAAPHGRPPHKLMVALPGGTGGPGKPQGAAAAAKPRKGHPAAATAVAVHAVPAALVPASKPRSARQKAERGRRSAKARAPRPRKAAGPRARLAAQAQRDSSPPPMYTRRLRPSWEVPPPVKLGSCTTVMVRNIPNKLRSGDIMALLDQHCARANKAAGAVVSAYDILYLPMDFRRQGNFGYAFVNLTTAAAAHRLYYSLEWCRWKVAGSKKVIHVDRADVQGTEKLVQRFRRLRLECETEEFLPALFSPPRDGANGAAPQRLGHLVPPRHPRPRCGVTAASA